MTRRASRPSLWLPLLLLLLPGAFLYGGRVEPRRDDGLEDPVERAMQSRGARLAERVALPEPFAPPPEFAPFGRAIAPRILQGQEARGRLLTNLGHVDWDADRDEIAAGMPAALRLAPGEVRRSARGTLRHGLNYVRLSEAAIAARGLDAVQADVEGLARIVGWLPERTLLVQVEPRDTEALLRLAAIDRARALEPYQKISPLLGMLPRLSRREAENPDLRVRVTLVPGLGGEGALERLLRVPGVSEGIPDESGDGAALRIRFDRVADLARRDEVLALEPGLDFVLANAESVPTTQAGSAEDGDFARPFDAVGVDGGGIDTNADGQRINNGTDDVPPQIVTVTDNGISIDTPSFSQTATQTIVSGFFIGPTHRKIHAIQNVTDSGTSCDAALSGGGTHGNTVASIIAAAPSAFGVYATKPGTGGRAEPLSMNLDGVARGARILVQDVGTVTQCTIHSMVERGGNVSPGNLSSRLAEALSGGGNAGHLVIFPFGSPNNFGPILQGGTYPSESNQVDTFLYNNRDYMVFVPVGNYGATISTLRLNNGPRVIPGAFDGSEICSTFDPASNDCVNPIQIPAPSTAKNIVAVGASMTDCFTLFGTADCEGSLAAFSSRGPATTQSLRMAPILTAPGADAGFSPFTSAVAVFRSSDNDNLNPVEAVLDEGNTGSSYSSAYATGAAAVLRDYFAQGFYPSGSRGPTGDRMPNISGALVKAALAASADFNEMGIGTQGEQTAAEHTLRRTRCIDFGPAHGTGVMCNSEQGYGRPVLTNVLPLAGWSDGFVLHPASGQPREYPAAGLLVFDRQSTGEALIDNGASTSVSHRFRVAGPSTVPTASGGLALAAAQLRIALAWPDRPSPANSGGPLINDLDLRLESPGPDSCLDAASLRPDGSACPAGAAADNVFYGGNDYESVSDDPAKSQWSRGRAASPEVHDLRNPVEAIHLSADPDNDRSFADSVLYAGIWRVTVKRGLGGATPGSITITVPTVAQDPDQIEDDNNNGRLDAGEDNNTNGLLDQPGQPYALVVSGPVFAGKPAPPLGPPVFPVSRMTLDRVAYDCGSGAIASIFDTTPGASAALASSVTTFTVLGSDGAVLDTETGIAFTAPVPGAAASAPVPIRLAGPAVSGNGILEADTGQTVRARYAPAGQAAVEATAAVRCSPDLIPESFTALQGSGSQVSIQGGCDDDPFPDAGEVVSYGVAIRNRSRQDSYADVVATLTASGPAAGAVRVLDSPRPVGLLPDGGANGVFFQVYVDPAAVAALPAAQRIVTMRLDLDSSERGVRLGRQSYSFTHALDSDRDIRRYSTDAIAGGREVRDLNRNGLIDPPGQVDSALGYVLPPEDVTFASLFSGTGAPPGHFTNELGEDLDLNGAFTATASLFERNIVPNVDGSLIPILDKGILNSNVIADPNHRAPWSFDNNGGGWIPFRHPESTASGISVNPLWEYRTGGNCGFQTAAGPSKFGVWHSGDGNPATPAALPAACDNHARPSDFDTPAKFELVFDVVESPIVARVNQALDARGFPYAVEFQRLGLNLNIQLIDGYAGGGVNLDNDADSDSIQSLLGQRMDAYYTRTLGGWPQAMVRFNNDDWPGEGIDPTNVSFNVQPPQRTFGPFQNPNGSPGFDGDESGFPGFTQNSNPNSTTPIPNAPPDFLPYPQPAAILAGVCTGGGAAGEPCVTADAGDPCVLQGGACTPQANTIAGPVRNFDITLLGYEGGFARLNSAGAVENVMNYLPGQAGNRWQIGIGFWAIESSTGQTDYGVAFDDVVFEWNEWHPEDEATLGVPPACSRFAGAGQPAGGPCATVTVDRTTLYECDETIEIAVRDAKCVAIGAGATATLGGACLAHAECGAGGVCTAALAAVEVAVVTESDATLVVADEQTLLYPTAKRFTLPAAAGTPGLFKGSVSLTTVKQGAGRVLANPATDHRFVVYYFDPLCDGDRDGQAGEDDFDNIDGDGVADAADNCPVHYNPLQEDGDADGAGDLCDNCPGAANADQADATSDGVGDVCEFDDADLDGFPPADDNCPDVRNPNQADIDNDGRGDLCDTLMVIGVSFGRDASGANAGAVFCGSGGTCLTPGDAIGDSCVTDEDCIRNCNAGICTVGNTGSAGGFRCTTGPVIGNSCTATANCGRCVGGSNPGADCATPPDCLGGGTCSTGACTNNFVSPQPKVGQSCITHADCYVDIDRDGDGVVDALDNCVIADNGPLQGPNDQADSDSDGLGDVCDGDCAGAVQVFRCRSNSNPCVPPVPSNQAVCNTASFGLGAQCTAYVQNAGACSDVDDDADADGVADLADDCAAIANPAIVPGGPQRDRDHDGLGDACDPAGATDDAGDGLPDDVVAFQGTLACSTRPLARLTLVDVPAYVDLDGDHDPFPDTGERGRVTFTVRNDGPALEDAVVTMVSSDPDVACITEAQILIPTLAAGATISLGSLDPGQPGFTFVASNALQSQPPPAPVARIDLSFQVTAPGLLGNAATLAVSLFADYNLPPGAQQFTLGPDGVPGTADDGKVIEDFDVDRNGDGNFTVRDTFLTAIAPGVFRGTCSNAPLSLCASAADCPAGGLCQSGAYLRGSDTGAAVGTVAATTCGGAFFSYGPFCQLDPDFPMDWHVHCAHGATNCPNLESGTCVGGCSFDTPEGGNHALSGPNSLHMGAHFRPDDALAGDTTHLRTLQGFMTPPINLAIMPRPGDLDFSFFHIARLMDNHGVGPGNKNQCVDCGDVQIQVDRDPNPSVDSWGFWDKLVPYQNVYDHKPNAWSTFGPYYCIFTPIDTGTAPPNSRGVHETICYPQGAWSHCGSHVGTSPLQTIDCPGPGVVEPSGVGVWVQTRFHLDSYLGQRIRIRWIAETWNFDESASSYYEESGTWASTTQDDGWWLDDIVLTGAVTQQVSPILDTTPRTGTCPADACNAAIGDMGTNAVLEVTDPAGAPIDGVGRIPTSGERIRLGASGSTFPGGCSNGHAEYQFLRDGVVAQAWSANPFFTDSPERTTRYTLLVRCTSDPGCTSAAGASIDLPVRTGEGGDVVFGARGVSFDPGLGVVYYRGACSAGSVGAPCNEAADCGAGGACNATTATVDDVTVLRLWAASDDGLDVVRGTVPAGPAPKGTLAGSFWTLPGLSGPCFLSNLAPAAAATGFDYGSGPLTQAQDGNPPPGGIIYYQASANGTGGANLDAFGCPSPSICSNPGFCEFGTSAGVPCSTNADCSGGGTCVMAPTYCSTDLGVAGQGGCGRHPICTGGSSPGKLCLFASECPGGGNCPLNVPQSAGQICLTLTGAPLGASPYGNCPPAGHPKRVVSRAGGLACP